MKKERRRLSRRIERILFILFLLWIPITHSQSTLRIPLYVHDKEIWVEVAQTPEERSYGLMGRKHLGRDEGMLFIFETEDYHGFWMKDTLLPLSIAFIGKDGRIVWIRDMKPLTSDSHVPPQTHPLCFGDGQRLVFFPWDQSGGWRPFLEIIQGSRAN